MLFIMAPHTSPHIPLLTSHAFTSNTYPSPLTLHPSQLLVTSHPTPFIVTHHLSPYTLHSYSSPLTLHPSQLLLTSHPTPFTVTPHLSPYTLHSYHSPLTLHRSQLPLISHSTPLTVTPHVAYPFALPFTTPEKSLRKHCEEYGSVLALRIFPEKGYAFIKYESHEIAARAIYSLNGQTFHGQVIKVPT